jgi:NADH:ubiquinone oxidoreductase subunit K
MSIPLILGIVLNAVILFFMAQGAVWRGWERQVYLVFAIAALGAVALGILVPVILRGKSPKKEIAFFLCITPSVALTGGFYEAISNF